jgi:hypothetical protein
MGGYIYKQILLILKETDHLEDVDVDGKIILYISYREKMCGLDSSDSGYRHRSVCEHSNDLLSLVISASHEGLYSKQLLRSSSPGPRIASSLGPRAKKPFLTLF